MKMTIRSWLPCVCLLAAAACGGAVETPPGDADGDVDAGDTPAIDAPPPVANVAGTYARTLTVDGMTREVIVHVPAAAAGTTPVPAVLMLHGTSGDGERYYNISGWREKADAEGFIAVFPTALTHCLFEDENGDGDFADPGERKLTTKWAAGKLGSATMPLCAPEDLAMLSPENRALADHPLADDLAFLDAVLDLLGREHAVDAKRVYASGFSNGASMTSRLALERSTRFAAIAAAAGGLNPAAAPAERPLSAVQSLGTRDDRFTTPLGLTELPIGPTALDDEPRLWFLIRPMLTVLQLGERYTYAEESVSGRRISTFTFAESTVGAGATNTLTFVLVEDAFHVYPNGDNHPLVMANPLWSFFSTQALP